MFVEREGMSMAKIRIQIGLLLIFLALVIVGFVYAMYYTQEEETKDGTLVEYRLPEEECHLWEVCL